MLRVSEATVTPSGSVLKIGLGMVDGEGDRAGGFEAPPHVVNGANGERAWREQPEQILGDAGGRVLLENGDVAKAGDVVLEALELDALPLGNVGNPEPGVVGQPALGAHGRALA